MDGVLGVVKAYTTRVGNGPLPTEAEPALEERLRQLGDEFGATTGRPRRCGWFDAVVVRYAARVNGLTGLAVTKLDVLDSFDEIPVGTAYQLDGDACEELPRTWTRSSACSRSTSACRAGTRSTGGARTLADLPGAGARVPRPARGAVGRADPLRERRHAARPDHRGLGSVP